MATAVRPLASRRDSQSMAPLTTVPVEPPNRNPLLARRWQARMVSASSTCTTSSTYELSRSGGRRGDGHARARYHPAALTPAKYHRAEAVHRDNPHRAVPLPEPARAAHQGPGGAGPDEQHVKLRKLASDGRRRGAVVRPPVGRGGVLGEPGLPVVR